MSLETLSDTSLKVLVKHCEEAVGRRMVDMEQALRKENVQGAYMAVGGADELRHIIAIASSQLRQNAKGT